MRLSFFYLLFSGLLLVACQKQPKEKPRHPVLQTDEATDQGVFSSGDAKNNSTRDSIAVIPVEHASFTMSLNHKMIYIDPTGNPSDYKDIDRPDLVLITDIHGDHFQPELLQHLLGEKTLVLMPRAVFEQIPEDLKRQSAVLENGQDTLLFDIQIEAIPMYNLREEAKDFHTKGRGNGYVLEADQQRIYISGDTEDIPEMRGLKDIDLAFICMNLPYTMTVEQAADAVLDFQPKKVYPYHFKGQEGFSDVHQFEELVHKENPDISIQILDWYRGAY